jgi:HPt (histidine-containing phosphotransfer) domain-containing protein
VGDQNKIDRIVVHVDPDLEDIIPEFLENLGEDLVSIMEALDKGDYQTARRLGHSMKGSGGGYGFDAITEMGGAIEKAAGAEEVETVRGEVAKIKDYLQKVEVIFE